MPPSHTAPSSLAPDYNEEHEAVEDKDDVRRAPSPTRPRDQRAPGGVPGRRVAVDGRAQQAAFWFGCRVDEMGLGMKYVPIPFLPPSPHRFCPVPALSIPSLPHLRPRTPLLFPSLPTPPPSKISPR
ncbi:hypothetical protein C8R45DRAFT_1101591 [Mycena sanguinolenta]|nr:hypothetical protein C8R45DRAFT_1101591 [Mycena sanguinolenta]